MKCNCSAEMDHFEDAYDGRENKMGEYYWRPIINPNHQNLKINYDKEGKL